MSLNRHYYPDPWPNWERKRPEELGLDPAKLNEAMQFSIANESADSRDLAMNKALTLEEPFYQMVGPLKERGDVTGVVLRNGYIVAEWGEPDRVDMTFSCSKSYVSTVAGLAYDHGIIRDVQHHVRDYVRDGGFDSEHNSQITWHQLLNQTSDWEGVLWDKPDWADRPQGNKADWPKRKLNKPGTVWKYNDVRVNRLALSLLRVWRRPLPQVLREYIMDPIGASPTWEWHGYENSWVKIDGVMMQSVSGGGHWGGGMWISALDHARFGYLCLRNGKWKERQLLSEEWIRMARTPTGSKVCDDIPLNSKKPMPAECQAWYGYMNWMLNTRNLLLPNCPESSFFHAGAGANIVWVDPEHDLVVVIRWISRDKLDGFLKRVVDAVVTT